LEGERAPITPVPGNPAKRSPSREKGGNSLRKGIGKKKDVIADGEEIKRRYAGDSLARSLKEATGGIGRGAGWA